MADDEMISVELDGETIIQVPPGQRYVRTLPFEGILTCVDCGGFVHPDLTGRHDAAVHGT